MRKPVLALLETREIHEQVPWAGLTVAAQLSGLELKRPELMGESKEHWKQVWTELGSLVETADAFITHDGIALNEFSGTLKERIAEGARVLVISDRNRLRETNAFLDSFGLAGTPYRILPSGAGGSTTLRIPRSTDCFLDRELLEGVDAATFNSLTAVLFKRDAVPVLLANDRTLAVDMTTDLEIDWNRLELSCIARWEADTGGAVLVLGDNILWDASRRWTDLSLMPGIQQNAVLTANLLKYLGKLTVAEVSPAQHCERAENNLADFVRIALRLRFGQEWWAQGVPLTIRQECAKRQEEEAHRKFPKEAYLNLLHLKTIIEKNWIVFQPHFKTIGETQGKDKALAWLDKFNEIRRLVAHPLKAHIAEYSMSPGEIDITREVDTRARALLDSLPRHS